MEIKVSKAIGFCSGVKRAIGIARQELEKGKKVYSLGPLIHNPKVVKELSDQGLEIVEDIEKPKD